MATTLNEKQSLEPPAVVSSSSSEERPSIKKQVSWSTDDLFASLKSSSPRRRCSTPETPSQALLLAYGLETPRPARGGTNLAFRVAFLAALVAGAWALGRRRVAASPPVRATPSAVVGELVDASPVAQQVVLAQQVLFNCSAVTERTPARVGCAIRRTFARLRMAITKHMLKLAVLLSLGFSPIPFVLSFI